MRAASHHIVGFWDKVLVRMWSRLYDMAPGCSPQNKLTSDCVTVASFLKSP